MREKQNFAHLLECTYTSIEKKLIYCDNYYYQCYLMSKIYFICQKIEK